MQPIWVSEPGHAKVTLSLDSCTRSPFPKDEAHGALIAAIETEANRIVKVNAEISIFDLDRATAEAQYGDAMYDAGARGPRADVLRLAYVPGVAFVEVPPNWALCATTGACGSVAFTNLVAESEKKKPDTMILFGKGRKQLMVRYGVAKPSAAGDASDRGERPAAALVKDLDKAKAFVLVSGVDAGAEKKEAKEAPKAKDAPKGPVAFPYPKDSEKGTPAANYWAWWRRSLGRRIRDGMAAANCSKEDLLRSIFDLGLKGTCSKVLGFTLSEADVAHLVQAPASNDWLFDIVDEKDDDDMVVDPWSVEGTIDYKKLTEKFGSSLISPELLKRIEKLTVGRGNVDKLHPWLTRSIFYSHRDLDVICTCVEKGIPFYLYTGRGPSSASMHLGHLIPFMMTQWLQKAFNVPLVIQMTDDEKFLWKGHWEPEVGDNLMHYRNLTSENVKDIIACGFDKKKTFIFSDLEYVGHMWPNIVRIAKAITYSQARGCFGFEDHQNIGQSHFPSVQAAPSFPSSFLIPLRGDDSMACLIPCAIDQDPYFRITRDIAHKIVRKDHPLKGKPALLHAKFFPPLQGAAGKMSASDENSAVYLTDTAEKIKEKVNNHAFSGGQQYAKDQREKGADLEVDVSYQWLRFFLHDDKELEKIGREYGTGQGDFWNTASVKDRLTVLLQEIVGGHIEKRAKITDAEVASWMAVRELEF